ncbi:ZIP family metal transporter [Gilvibacter sediminis]|uniref:ZIP family metal transporter n=1 Tax=Gilvibacter sediminis TaxID=379071 RepID=UPI0023505F0F|nr:ZIP family metal transporter [Gilvibacter sediminis]MDC7997805.1 ZIP family metal transporter [Gilvibacter sediminis]
MLYLSLFLSVIIGYGVAYGIRTKDTSRFNLLLSFSGAFLLSVTVFEYLPELYQNSENALGIFIMGGILLQLILDFFSKGAEHGHIHIDTKSNSFPFALFISLSIHALLEGIPVAASDHLLYGVLIHKVPIAAILGIFLIKSGFKPWITLLFLSGFALMTPLGSYMSQHFMGIQEYLPYLNAIVVGIFLHVSTTILFESNKNHSFNLIKLLTVILAMGIAYFI